MNAAVGYWFGFLISPITGCLGGFFYFLPSVVGSRKRRSLAILLANIFRLGRDQVVRRPRVGHAQGCAP